MTIGSLMSLLAEPVSSLSGQPHAAGRAGDSDLAEPAELFAAGATDCR
jgi:hypothetical protein